MAKGDVTLTIKATKSLVPQPAVFKKVEYNNSKVKSQNELFTSLPPFK